MPKVYFQPIVLGWLLAWGAASPAWQVNDIFLHDNVRVVVGRERPIGREFSTALPSPP